MNTALSVNLNKVALLRNSRHLGIPSVVRAAELCLQAGAHGITVHPRPDERHIRAADVADLADLMRDWPDREFNIEGNPVHNLMGFLPKARPHQVTFVPDSEGQFTSDHGWSFPADADRLRPLVRAAQDAGARVSLFMDADPAAMSGAKAVGADRVELYTEPYAQAHGSPSVAAVLAQFDQAAASAQTLGLGINAGHDLNRYNLRDFVQTVQGVQEVSIGHALIADALELGYRATIEAYLACLR
ncbi:MAG: pyridoxine 5'-phosphate synthase [Betaproteobacteria bacterium]|nr:pyridoxine 5'-phosphate synthase [Betaproteobacteria bacterium]NBY05757.1 pyridoxine 5'-phosphate synthase [Betaproteobacteria bacterium]